MNDDLTTRLSRQLHEQVDDWQTTPLTLDGVRGRARSIRRTRRIVATAAVAAVIAIAAPVAVLAGGGLDAGPDPTLPPATDNPSEAVDTANPEIEGSGLGVPYLHGHTLTLPDGTDTRLLGTYDSVVVLADGQVFGIGQNPGSRVFSLDRLTDDGAIETSVEMADFGVAVNAEGTALSYVTSGDELRVADTDGEVSLGSHRGQPAALLGGPTCSAASDCTVFLNAGEHPIVVDGTGDETAVPGDPVNVEDASAAVGRVALQTSYDEREPGSCSSVVANDASEGTVFDTCDFRPDRFSPDGAYLSANEAYGDGIGPRFVAILDGETGEQVARFEPEDGFLNTSVWEDPEHLLTIAYDYDGGTWSVVRLGADGSTETVLGPVEGGEMQPPWRLVGAG